MRRMADANRAIDRFGENDSKGTRGPPAAVVSPFIPVSLELNRTEILSRSATMFIVEWLDLNRDRQFRSMDAQSCHFFPQDLPGECPLILNASQFHRISFPTAGLGITRSKERRVRDPDF